MDKKNKTPRYDLGEKDGKLVDGGNIKINRKNRRRMKAAQRKMGERQVKNNPNRVEYDDKVVYNDKSFIDKTKVAVTHGLKEAKERIAKKFAKHELPKEVKMEREDLRTDIVIINKDGKERELLPDVEPQHKILCHGNIAKVMLSNVCMLVRITQNKDEETGKTIDGSWAITPAQWEMMKATTIQHVKKRRWWWLRRYWYEISFDGRVQPAHLLFDYGMDPTLEKQKMYITREYVKVRNRDEDNDYFRIWKNKPNMY